MIRYLQCMRAKSLQSCPTLCDPIDGSPPGSSIPGILQARTVEWVVISFSNAWKWKMKVKSLSRVWLFVTPWTAAHQAPPSMGFSRQEYWSGVPLPSPQTLYTFPLTLYSLSPFSYPMYNNGHFIELLWGIKCVNVSKPPRACKKCFKSAIEGFPWWSNG